MKISNSRINQIIEKILFNTYDTSLSHEEKRNLIFEKIGIKDNSLKIKYKGKIDNKIKKIDRQISEYYSVSDSSSNFSDSSSSLSQSSYNSSSSSEVSGNFKISSNSITYPTKKMTIAEKKKFCRKHGLIYDRALDKAGKPYCRKDRRGRKKKKSVEEHVEDKSVEEHVEDKSVEEHVEDKSVEEDVEDKSAEEDVEDKDKLTEGDIIVKEEDNMCNIKEDGSDLSCSKGQVCNLDNKKCVNYEDNMMVHNINGADVIGDELIVKKLKELMEEKNEFNIHKQNDYDIKKCFGLLVDDSDSD